MLGLPEIARWRTLAYNGFMIVELDRSCHLSVPVRATCGQVHTTVRPCEAASCVSTHCTDSEVRIYPDYTNTRGPARAMVSPLTSISARWMVP